VQNDQFCTPAMTETSAIAERWSIAGAQNPIDLRAPQMRFALQGVFSYQRAYCVGRADESASCTATIAQLVTNFIDDFWPLDPVASGQSCVFSHGGRTNSCKSRRDSPTVVESVDAAVELFCLDSSKMN
jgi:hypothetical protein